MEHDPGWYADATRLIRRAAPGAGEHHVDHPAGTPVELVQRAEWYALIRSHPGSGVSQSRARRCVDAAHNRGRETEHFPNDYADIVAVIAACGAHGSPNWG
jgi:hypothetical protein